MLFLLSSLLAQASAYTRCSETDYPYAGAVVANIPILLGPTFTVMVNGSSVPISVTGTISVINGCSVSKNINPSLESQTFPLLVQALQDFMALNKHLTLTPSDWLKQQLLLPPAKSLETLPSL
jgi:hypothetical protein